MNKYLIAIVAMVILSLSSLSVSGQAVAAEQTDNGQPQQILRLTEDDYREVADELGVEVAAVKAVVEIEAGRSHQGFSSPGKPLVNFDLSMFRRFAAKRGINLSKYYKSHPQVFSRGSRGSQAVVNKRLSAARTIHETTAIEGTFWGMFQIGGFNWKKCGAKSIDEFVMLMSRSERDQLELFARFITNGGMLQALRDKNWAKFARVYNGPSYARRGYHTRMAAAYARYKKMDKSKATDEKASKETSQTKPKSK